MADVTVKAGPLYQSPEVVADFAEAVSPFFVNGGIISQEFTNTVGKPLEADPDNLVLEILGAKSITFAEFQNSVGVKMAFTVADISGAAGKTLTVPVSSSTLIRCLVFYRV
jgi:hypothetical protein